MADYKLYDTQNHSVLIDPSLEKEKTFDNYEDAFKYNYSQNHVNHLIIKDSIPPEIKASIEKNIGKIEYSNERVADQEHYAVVRNRKGSFDSLEINKQPGGYKIDIKSGFPDQDQALKYNIDLQIQKTQKEINKDLTISR